MGASELVTEFDFTFFPHHLTPVKLWDKTQRCCSAGQQATKKDCSDFVFSLEWTSQRPVLTEEQFVDILLKHNTHRHSLTLAFQYYQKGRQPLVICSLLTSTHMSSIKSMHNLLYTEVSEFAGSIKHHMILPQFTEGDSRRPRIMKQLDFQSPPFSPSCYTNSAVL